MPAGNLFADPIQERGKLGSSSCFFMGRIFRSTAEAHLQFENLAVIQKGLQALLAR